jgi:hypothetical protein
MDKQCSRCKSVKDESQFGKSYISGKVWKLCNDCRTACAEAMRKKHGFTKRVNYRESIIKVSKSI